MTLDLSADPTSAPAAAPADAPTTHPAAPRPDRSAASGLGAVGTTARTMFAEADLDSTLGVVMTLSAHLFRCDAVGILLLTNGAVESAAASCPDAQRADSLQVTFRQGPGFQAIDRDQPVIINDLRADGRWLSWGPPVADLGMRSVLSVRLEDGDTSGALNLYSRVAHQFHTGDLAPAAEFAQLGSIAIAVAREREQLLGAIESRGLVGQAQGILMQLYGISAGHAFTVLRRYSVHLDTKLRVVAEGVIRDRCLPELADLDHPSRQPVLPSMLAG